MRKLAILTSHPIQYQVPLFQKLAKEPQVDLTVYFCWDFGVGKESFDHELGKNIKWDLPLLDGYNYKFLKNYSPRPENYLLGLINFGIVRELKNGKYDLLFVHGWNSFTNILAVLTAFLLGISVAMHGDNCFACELVKPLWKRGLKKIILTVFFKKIRHFLYMGNEDKKFYKYHGVPENKLISMPYATDNDYFYKLSESIDRKKVREREKVKNNIVILFVGKLVNRKRPMDLLKAYESLAKNYKPKTKSLSLIFVGDGNLRPELEKYARDRNLKDVVFAGFKNLTETPEYYAIADIFVIPSFNECWGIVVNEAMCFGLPIIASDTVGAISDLVLENKNGLIYKTGEIENLVYCLEQLVKDDKKRQSFGKKSLEIIKNYSFDKDVEGILRAIRS
ncbi:MAG: glycosyltransferase family 4 protein [Candidatus Paceibacterota bacterium]